MSPGAAIGTVDTVGAFAESCGVVTMTASADTTGIWQNISTTGAVTSVDSPMLSNEYVYGSYVDEPLALINSGGTYFYADNRVYSPAAMTDVWGAVVERYRYDSYGNRTIFAADDSTLRSASAVGNQRGFTGYYADAESGFYYVKARMYSSVLGRFISRDPIKYRGGGMGLYSAYFVPGRLDFSGMNIYCADTWWGGQVCYEDYEIYLGITQTNTQTKTRTVDGTPTTTCTECINGYRQRTSQFTRQIWTDIRVITLGEFEYGIIDITRQGWQDALTGDPENIAGEAGMLAGAGYEAAGNAIAQAGGSIAGRGGLAIAEAGELLAGGGVLLGVGSAALAGFSAGTAISKYIYENKQVLGHSGRHIADTTNSVLTSTSTITSGPTTQPCTCDTRISGPDTPMPPPPSVQASLR
jgi:RHS repeat-associated protein